MTQKNKITSVTVPLEYPVEHEGKIYTELTLRRMRAGDALVGEGETNPTRGGWLLYAALADVPVEVIEKLDIDDIETLGEKAVPLMGKSVARAQAEAQAKAKTATH